MHKKLPMSFSGRRKYLFLMEPRYKKASKEEKHILLNEMQQVTGLHRKSIICLMNGLYSSSKREPCPRHKNDNRFVEQRNSFLIRSYIGNDRLDTVAQTILLNRIYQKLWLYHNFFLPCRKTVKKEVVASSTGTLKVRRKFDQAVTPLERLEKLNAIEPEKLELLKSLRAETNPLDLREEIYKLINELYALPMAKPGGSEDIRRTLNLPIELLDELLSVR